MQEFTVIEELTATWRLPKSTPLWFIRSEFTRHELALIDAVSLLVEWRLRLPRLIPHP